MFGIRNAPLYLSELAAVGMQIMRRCPYPEFITIMWMFWAVLKKMRAGAGQIQHSCVCVYIIYINTDAIVTCVDVGVVCVVFWWPVLTLNNIVFEMETNTNNIFAFEINNMMTAINRNINFSIRR